MHYRLLITVPALLSFAACGGGGGGGDGGDSPPPAQSVSGAWSGSVSSGGFASNEADCLVTEDNELACVLTDPSSGQISGGASGTVTVTDGNTVSGSGTLYAAPGFVLGDGTSTVADFTIGGGAVSEQQTLELTLTALGSGSSLSLSYDEVYERGSSLATVDGVYSSFDLFGDPGSFVIDPDGSFFLQTQTGCAGNGEIGIPDARHNAYSVSVAVSGCSGLDGSYEGFGVTADLNGTDDLFLFAVFSAQAIIVGDPVR